MLRRMLRRLVVAISFAVALLVLPGPVAWSDPNGSVPATTEAVPGTTLEAQARDDGTPVAPWLIGSGIAAVAAVAIGGTLMKRRMD